MLADPYKKVMCCAEESNLIFSSTEMPKRDEIATRPQREVLCGQEFNLTHVHLMN